MDEKAAAGSASAPAALLGAGLCFGLSSPLARVMGGWFSPFGVVFVRFLFALPFAAGLFLARGRQDWGAVGVGKLAPFAVLFPLSVCLFTFSLFATTIAMAIFSFYIANLLSSVLVGVTVDRERLTTWTWAALGLVAVALILLTRPFDGLALDGGMVLGFLSGLVQTAASWSQRRLSRDMDAPGLALVQVLGGLVIGGVCFAATGAEVYRELSLAAFWVGLLFGVVFFLVNVLMVYGFQGTEIGIGSVLLSTELLFGPLAAYLMFKETMTSSAVVAGVLIAAAVILLAQNYRKPRPARLRAVTA